MIKLNSVMRFEILNKDSYAALRVYLNKGESVKAESGAMVSSTPQISVGSQLDGGLFSSISRFLAQESVFFQSLTAKADDQHVILAPKSIGALEAIHMTMDNPYILKKNAYLASDNEINITTFVQNIMHGLFSREGFVLLYAKGNGTMWFNAFGNIISVDLNEGEDYIVDNGHAVAWPASMTYVLQKASSGWFSSITSGEGIVCRFTGPGRVYIQSRDLE